MDKNTVLAFLIIALILIGMPYYYEMIGLAPPPQEEVKKSFLSLLRLLRAVHRSLLQRTRPFKGVVLLKGSMKGGL